MKIELRQFIKPAQFSLKVNCLYNISHAFILRSLDTLCLTHTLFEKLILRHALLQIVETYSFFDPIFDFSCNLSNIMRVNTTCPLFLIGCWT